MFGSNNVDLGLAITAEDHASEAIARVGESLNRVSEIGKSFLVGALGYMAISEAIGGVEDLGKSLIATNATAEQLQQTFTAIYQSSTEGAQAMGWLTSFAMNAPFTREAIQQAGTTIAALGMNITQVLPSLGNMAAVMGQGMPTAAQAFMDAYEGRFQMLQRDLHVSKQQLEEYGLQIDKTGKIVQSTFAPAFEAFVAAHYPNGMALQMETFNGQMSNFVDHLQLIERSAGGAMFKELKGSLTDVIGYMNTHQGEILGIAAAFGQDLAAGMRLAGEGAQWLMSVVPPAISVIAGVWTRLQGTLDVVGTGINAVQRGIGNYLGQVLVPAVQTSLGFMLHFWDEHGKEMIPVLDSIGTNVQTFLGFLASNFTSYMTYLKGIMEVGWGAIEIVVGGALDLLSGNMVGFGETWSKGWRMIWDGATHAVEGAAEIMIRLVAGSFDAINTIEHTLYTSSQKIFGGLYDMFASLEEPVIRLVHGIFQPLFDGFNAIMDAAHNLSVKMASIPGLAGRVPIIPDLHMTMQTSEAAIAAIHKAAQTDNHPLGWAANVGITSLSMDQAIAALRAQEKSILAQNAADYPGVPTFTSTQAQKKGADAFDAFIAGLQKLEKGGFKLPAGVDTTGLLGGGVTSLPVAGFGGATDAAAAARAAAHAHAALVGQGAYATYAATAGAGEGSTIAAYGAPNNPQAQTNAHLRDMITYLQHQISLLMSLLTSTQRQEFQTELGARAGVATAQNTSQLAAAVTAAHQGSNPLTGRALLAAGRP